MGPPLAFQVYPRRPGRPSAPFIVSTGTSVGGCFLVVAWREPVDEGGAEVLGHDLRLWQQDHFMRNEEPLVFSGQDVWPEYHMEGVEPGMAYVLQVRCHNEAGTSEWSTMSDPMITALKPPSCLEKPRIMDVGLGFVNLQWAPSDVEAYEISVEPLSSGEQPWVYSVQNVREASLELMPRQMYRFRVRGCRKAECGPWSEESDQVYTSSLGASVSSPSAPRQVEVWREGMALVWDAPENPQAPIARYLVKAQARGQKDLQFQTADASTRLTVRGLRGNTPYTFYIFAITSQGLSEASEATTLRTAAQPPRPPKFLSVVHAEQTEITLRWEPPDDNGGQPLQRFILQVGTRTQEFAADDREGTVTGLQGNQRYLFRLCAKSDAGISRCVEIFATSGPVVPGPPGIPRMLGDATATSFSLAWSAPSETGGSSISGYVLQGDLVDRFEVTQSKVLVQGLEPDSRYRFRVCARNVAGLGGWSEWSELLRTAPKAPGQPARPRATAASATSIEVTWEDTTPGAWEVAVERNCGGEITRRCKAPPLLVKNLARFTSYVFRVRAVGSTGCSDWSEASEPMSTSDDWSDEEIVDFLLPRFGSLANVFRTLDTNCDGFIREQDLYGLRSLGLSDLSEERIAHLFACLDGAERGMVTLRDFSKCLSRVAPRSMPSPKRQVQRKSSPLRSVSPPLPRAERASFELTYVSPSHH